MTEANPELDPKTAVAVCRIVGPHGVRGEVAASPLTDFPEHLAAGARVWLRGKPVSVETSRWRGKVVYLKLSGIETRNEAEALRGEDLMRPAGPLEEGRYYRHDVEGLEVRLANGDVIGRVADILSTGSADVYVVRGPLGEILLPATDDVILEVDPRARRIVVELVEGLEFQRRSPPDRRRTPRKSPEAVVKPEA